MSTQIEETLKALTEFEQELDRIKAYASESRRQMAKRSSEWSETAGQRALDQARKMAAEEVSRAKAEAEVQAAKIKKEGAVALRAFEESLAGNKEDSVELVMKSLLGETR